MQTHNSLHDAKLKVQANPFLSFCLFVIAWVQGVRGFQPRSLGLSVRHVYPGHS